MTKSQKSNKETKKQPVLTPKEKKAVKQQKKHVRDIVPINIRGS
ncbi:MAG: hypothetical protein ACLPXB_16495 [Thiobacillaceae bacterium]